MTWHQLNVTLTNQDVCLSVTSLNDKSRTINWPLWVDKASWSKMVHLRNVSGKCKYSVIIRATTQWNRSLHVHMLSIFPYLKEHFIEFCKMFSQWVSLFLPGGDSADRLAQNVGGNIQKISQNGRSCCRIIDSRTVKVLKIWTLEKLL